MKEFWKLMTDYCNLQNADHQLAPTHLHVIKEAYQLF
jgi:hypothetical protein